MFHVRTLLIKCSIKGINVMFTDLQAWESKTKPSAFGAVSSCIFVTGCGDGQGPSYVFPKSSPFIQRFGIKAHIGFKESMKFYSKHSGRTEQTEICVKSNSGHMRKDAQGPQLFFGASFIGFRERSWGAVECYTGEFLFQLTGLD